MADPGRHRKVLLTEFDMAMLKESGGRHPFTVESFFFCMVFVVFTSGTLVLAMMFDYLFLINAATGFAASAWLLRDLRLAVAKERRFEWIRETMEVRK